MDAQKNKVSYSLQASHPDGGDVVSESYPTIKAAVEHAVELLQTGYTVEIASSPLIETR
jgi:ribosomal protein S1